jgi:hypothetical protein
LPGVRVGRKHTPPDVDSDLVGAPKADPLIAASPR